MVCVEAYSLPCRKPRTEQVALFLEVLRCPQAGLSIESVNRCIRQDKGQNTSVFFCFLFFLQYRRLEILATVRCPNAFSRKLFDMFSLFLQKIVSAVTCPR